MRSIDLHRGLLEQALTEDDVESRVRRFIHDYFALQARVFRGEEPEFVHFGDLRALMEPHSTVVWAEYNQLFRLVRDLVRSTNQSWNKAELNAKAHMLISQLLWSVVWISTYVTEDFGRVANRFADIMLYGIAASPVDLDGAGIEVLQPRIADTDKLSQESFFRAATELINEQGYRGASVYRISAVLNVTKGAFYYHNDTRDGLVVACFDRTFEAVRQAQNEAMKHPTDGITRVTRAAAGLVSRQMTAEGTLLRTSALTAIGMDLRTDMARRMNLLTFRFADMLNDGLADGSVRICDIRIASEMVTAMINSAEELHRWVPGANQANAAHLYVRPLLFGLLERTPVKLPMKPN